MKRSENNTLSSNIVTIIKQKKIKPIPKIYFSLGYMLIYVLLIFLLAVLSLLTAIIYSYLSVLDPILIGQIQFKLLVFMIFPFVCGILIIILSYAFYYLFKKTDGGYKYGVITIMNTIIILSCFFAFIFYQTGIYKDIELSILPKIGFSEIAGEQKKRQLVVKLWQNPDKGLLIGTITAINGDELVIEDTNEVLWKIFMNEDTSIREDVLFSIGIEIKIQGHKTAEGDFIAQNIIASY